MAVEQWNNFTDYVIGDEVQNGGSTKYGCILGNINQEPPNATYWNVLNPPSSGGIVSLQALTSADNGGNLILTSTNDSINFNVNAPTGAIDLAVNFPEAPPAGIVSLQGLDAGDNGGNIVLTSATATFTTTPSTGTIDMTIQYPEFPSVVDSLNNLIGAVSLLDGGNVTITPDVGAGTITLSVPSIPSSVASLNGCQNVVSLTNGGNVTVTPNVGAGTISLSVPSIPISVASLNGCQNVVSLTNGGNVTITPDVGAGTITLSVPSIPSSVTSLNGLTNAVNLTSPNASITFNVSGQNIQLQSATQPVYQATYYKSTAQNLLITGDTDITFDRVGSWNNPNGYITHTNGTTDFTVVQTGLYQLDFNISVLLNNGSWSPTVARSVSIDITRGTEQGVLTATGLQALANYNQQVNGSYYLVAGDVINCRINNPYTLGTPTPPQAQCIQNTFDLNTFFAWQYISA